MEKEAYKNSNEEYEVFAFYVDYSLGVFLSLVLGYIVSKVYHSWAIVYGDSNYDPNLPTSWMSDSPPMWIFATENPDIFTSIVVITYIIIGILFTRCLRKRFNRKKS